MEEKKDKVYKEILGEPSINKNELKKENEVFTNDEISKKEQTRILNQKIQRIEKTVYYIAATVGFILAIEILRIWGIL